MERRRSLACPTAVMASLATCMLAGIASLAQSASAGDEVASLDDLIASFGWDLATAEIKSQKLGKGLYVLFGIGGNIGVSIGPSGTLIVDDQFPELMPKIEAAIRKLGGRSVDFAINTHWHFDHAEGNLALGPAGTWIVSQANSRDRMASGSLINLTMTKYRQQAYPPDALPVISFDDHMSFHFNGERIDLIHPGPAHTTGDTAVLFRGHNAVHMGDVFNNTGYPFIDADSGGEIDGMIAFCESVLAELKPGAIVIPGHGAVTDYAALQRYIGMLKTVRDRVSRMIERGMSLAEVEAARPTADWDATFGDVANSLGFVDRVYTSLKKK
ncbi:MAG: MBL fold metallo-hydrolase [Gammaproteobacteria bacterium]|nr:MBL fold metallo-hydrolase [Gammaproteobacteria bacterium]